MHGSTCPYRDSNLRPHPATCHENHLLTLSLMRVETQLKVGMHYNLDRSRCFYVTLLDLAEPKEPHREIGELLNTGHEQKRVEQKKKQGEDFVLCMP